MDITHCGHAVGVGDDVRGDYGGTGTVALDGQPKFARCGDTCDNCERLVELAIAILEADVVGGVYKGN